MSSQQSTDLPRQIEVVLEDVFFRPAHWHSAYEVTVLRLAQAIKLGALRPGARLPSERELVERLQVSRTTLREGIRALQHQGYLDTRRGRTGGTFIAKDESLTPTKRGIQRIADDMNQDLPSLLDLRLAVEPKCAELAALRATDETIENLRFLVDRGEAVPKSGLRQADSTLHIAIAHSAQSDRLLDLVLEEQMRLHELLGYLRRPRTTAGNEHQSPVGHRDIVDAIADRDPVGSYKSMRTHIEATNSALIDFFAIEGAQ